MPGQSPAGQAPTKGVGLSPLFEGASPAREGLGNARAIACRAGSYEGLGVRPAFRRSEPCSRDFELSKSFLSPFPINGFPRLTISPFTFHLSPLTFSKPRCQYR